MEGAEGRILCPQCGTEVSKLTVTWGRGQWKSGLLIIPMFLLIFASLHYGGDWLMHRNKLDYVTDLQPTFLELRPADDHVEVLGRVKNSGKHVWHRVNVEAEFFDDAGKFLNQVDARYYDFTVLPGAEEHVKLTLETKDERILKGNPKVVLKVSDAHLRHW